MEQLWSVALLAILLGPIIAAIVIGIRRPGSGAPQHSDTSEAHAYTQIASELRDVRNNGQGY